MFPLNSSDPNRPDYSVEYLWFEKALTNESVTSNWPPRMDGSPLPFKPLLNWITDFFGIGSVALAKVLHIHHGRYSAVS